MNLTSWKILILSLLMQGMFTAEVYAVPEGFSADTVQRAPGKPEIRGRIFVQGDFVRTEREEGGSKRVRIYDTHKNVVYLLELDQKKYRKAPYFSSSFRQKKGGGRPLNPCDSITDARCRRLGEKKLSGRGVIEWEITIGKGDKVSKIRQWIDKDRGMILRYADSSGDYGEMRYKGITYLGNRRVERWENRVHSSKADVGTTTIWYDPQLNLAIKEADSKGQTREMLDIRIGPQDRRLFDIPRGFQASEK